MATTKYTLTESAWVRISAPGEQGSVWRRVFERGAIVIDHTTLSEAATIDVGSPEEISAGLDKDKGFVLGDIPVVLPPDDAHDAFYALMVEGTPIDKTAEVVFDSINGVASGKASQDVFVQSNVSNLFRAFLQTYEKEDITLSSDAAIDDTQITLTTGHGRASGDYLILYTDDYFIQARAKNVAGDVITLQSPLYLPFPAAATTIVGGKIGMSVDGSVTPVTFKFDIPSQNFDPIDITVVKMAMAHAASADDGTFGGIAELANGLFLRKENSSKFNYGTYKKNLDFRFINADVEYTNKAPSGQNGTNVTIEIQGQENFDQVIRIAFGDTLKAVVQDDLTGLILFSIAIIGSYTAGE